VFPLPRMNLKAAFILDQGVRLSMRPFPQRPICRLNVAIGVCLTLCFGFSASANAAFGQITGVASPPPPSTPCRWPSATTASGKKIITHDVYDGWRSIRGTQLSRDGAWLVYALVPQDGDGELVARSLKTGAEFRHPRGQNPQITPDGRAVAFAILPPKAETERARKAKKKPDEMPKNALGLMDLTTGQGHRRGARQEFCRARKGNLPASSPICTRRTRQRPRRPPQLPTRAPRPSPTAAVRPP
jgi:hypothetical protein